MPTDDPGAEGRVRPSPPGVERPRLTYLPVDAPLEPADVAELCERLEALLATTDGEVGCDVGSLADPDATTIDALARLQLTAIRLGRRVRVCHACDRLEELLGLVGLCEILLSDASGGEAGRQPEEREQPLRVEEERDGGDPPV